MFRPVRPSDAADIAAIYCHYVATSTVTFDTEQPSVEQMRSRIEAISAQFPYYVCEEDGRVVGYAYAHLWRERPAYGHTWETSVYVAEGFQGRGVGRGVMQRVIDDCRKRGAHALVACITADNSASIALHESFGFERVSLFREVGYKFGRWLDDADYLLNLSAVDSSK